MPGEDFSKWAKPDGIATLLKMWADGFNRLKTGSFAILKNNKEFFYARHYKTSSGQ